MDILQATWSFCEKIYFGVTVDIGVLTPGNIVTNDLPLARWDNGINPDIVIFHSNATGLNYSIDALENEMYQALSSLLTVHVYLGRFDLDAPSDLGPPANLRTCVGIQSW